MLAVMLLRALLALAAGTWTLLRQRGFWVAIAGCVLFNRVYTPGAPKVRCPESALVYSKLALPGSLPGVLPDHAAPAARLLHTVCSPPPTVNPWDPPRCGERAGCS